MTLRGKLELLTFRPDKQKLHDFFLELVNRIEELERNQKESKTPLLSVK